MFAVRIPVLPPVMLLPLGIAAFTVFLSDLLGRQALLIE
jgi:hypothetical protein